MVCRINLKVFRFFVDRLIGLISGIVRKYFIKRYAKNERDAKSQLQGGGVFFLFHGDDRLPGHTHFFSQLLLGHFIVEKA